MSGSCEIAILHPVCLSRTCRLSNARPSTSNHTLHLSTILMYEFLTGFNRPVDASFGPQASSNAFWYSFHRLAGNRSCSHRSRTCRLSHTRPSTSNHALHHSAILIYELLTCFNRPVDASFGPQASSSA